ncbi:hypothetical protein MJO28_000424 [Puccinia striiformis f. sp. tritici]|uniref:Uncharacterized protein n=1 Tax=Puccinia striiformis f. sp. tritici TaxID=168172 RepID=A0ACC0EXW5_9BASI|nr:hypothetical protein MJO28_000424 [Puccinia striiformis f. sp. tritici]
MQFISFITLFVGLILYPALTLASCEFKRYGARNQTALATCVSNFNTEPSHVDDSECGGANLLTLIIFTTTKQYGSQERLVEHRGLLQSLRVLSLQWNRRQRIGGYLPSAKVVRCLSCRILLELNEKDREPLSFALVPLLLSAR